MITACCRSRTSRRPVALAARPGRSRGVGARVADADDAAARLPGCLPALQAARPRGFAARPAPADLGRVDGTRRVRSATATPRRLGRVPGRDMPARTEGARHDRARRLPGREGRLPDPAGRPDDGQRLRARRRPASTRRSSWFTATGRGRSKTRSCRSRCIGAAKLGFFVLAVDAFGAGRAGRRQGAGRVPRRGDRGDPLARRPAALGPPGLREPPRRRLPADPPRGRRRPDRDHRRQRRRQPVDVRRRLGPTGSRPSSRSARSATIGRTSAPRCCLCEVVPGALRFTEEWGVLGLIAPRALIVVNATPRRPPVLGRRGEEIARRGRADLRPLRPARTTSATPFSSRRHDYSRPMREAMYGWMTLHLKGEGDGSPDPRARVQDRRPRNPPLLPRRHPPRRLDDDPPVRRGRGPKARRREGGSERRGGLEDRGRGAPEGARREGLRRLPGRAAGVDPSFDPSQARRGCREVHGLDESAPDLRDRARPDHDGRRQFSGRQVAPRW